MKRACRWVLLLFPVVLCGCIWGSARPAVEHYLIEEQDLPFQVRGSFAQLFPGAQIESAMSIVRVGEPLQYKILFRNARNELRTALFTPDGQLLPGE